MNTIIALALALAPSPTPTHSTPLDVQRVDIVNSEPCADMIGLDHAGHFAGAITLCATDDGHVDIDAGFADGVYLAVRHDADGNPTIDSNDANGAAERIRLILARVDPVGDDGWVPCAVGVGATIVSIIAANAVGAIINTYVGACSCLPLLVEEFEDIDCPGF